MIPWETTPTGERRNTRRCFLPTTSTTLVSGTMQHTDSALEDPSSLWPQYCKGSTRSSFAIRPRALRCPVGQPGSPGEFPQQRGKITCNILPSTIKEKGHFQVPRFLYVHGQGSRACLLLCRRDARHSEPEHGRERHISIHKPSLVRKHHCANGNHKWLQDWDPVLTAWDGRSCFVLLSCSVHIQGYSNLPHGMVWMLR